MMSDNTRKMLSRMLTSFPDKTKPSWRNKVNDYIISTIFTSDLGWETAVGYKGQFYPVQRYGNEADAEIGHYKWCEKAKTMTELIMIGAEEYNIPDSEIKLK